MTDRKLDGKVALVTGGATGIGRAAALALAEAGAAVVVNHRASRDAAESLAAVIAARGGRAFPMIADVSDDAQVKAMMERVEAECGGLDILVNNAGWSTRVPHEKTEELTDAIWDHTLATNLKGPFYCIRAAAPLLRKRPGAAVVNVASMAAVTGRGSSLAYAAAKSGLVTMTRSLARALAPEIRVNAVLPGLIRTGFAGWGEEQCEAVEKTTPLRRLATVEDIGAAILFLAAEGLAMTGETIQMDGGLTVLGQS